MHSTASSTASTDMLASPLKITFVTLWIFMIVGCLAVDVIMDVVHDRFASFPLTPLLALSVGLSLLALCMTALLGRWVRRGFALYQPFVGGQVFVCLQATGYTLVTVATALKVAFASAAQHSSHRYGVFAVLGVFAAVAQVVLMLSLQFFVAPRRGRRATTRARARASSSLLSAQQQQQQRRHRHRRHLYLLDSDEDEDNNNDADADAEADDTTRLSGMLHDMAQSPRREVLLLTLLMPIEIASAVAAEHYGVSYGRVAVVLTMLFVGASMTILHTCLARPYLPRSYHAVLRPFALPSWQLSVMQLCANALLLTCVSGNVVLYTLHPHTPPAWHLACALAAVTGMCTHLLLLRRLGLTLVSRDSDATAATAAVATRSAHTMPTIADDDTLQTPLLASLLSIVCSALVYGSVLTASSHHTTWLRAGVDSSSKAARSSSHRDAVVQVQWVLSMLLFALPPFTHLQGRVAFGAAYAMYNPFGGDVDFVLLHAAAWTAYGIGLFLATLHASEHAHDEFLLLYVTCLLLAQLFLHVALHVFHRQRSKPTTTTAATATAAATTTAEQDTGAMLTPSSSSSDYHASDADDDSEHVTQLMSVVMNNNMLLALVLGTVSVLLRAVCDGIVLSNSDNSSSSSTPSTAYALARAATVLGLLATPIAQLSLYRRDGAASVTSSSTPSLLALTHGSSSSGSSSRDSGGNAALQAMGWLLYSMMVLAAVLSECAVKERQDSSNNGSLASWSAGYVPMQYTYVGMLYCVPLLCMLLCSFLAAQAGVQRTRAAAQTRRAALQLHTLLQRHGVAGDELARCEQLLCALAGRDAQQLLLPLSSSTTCSPRGGGVVHDTQTMMSSSNSNMSSSSATAARAAAQCLVGVMCVVCLVAFLGAIYVADVSPVTTLVFVLAGLAALSLSCVSLHGVYGARVHDDGGAYTLFMPFVGGARFVLEQAVGWASYTACLCLGIACLVDGHAAPRVCVALALLSVVAQLAILHSIDYFCSSSSRTAAGAAAVTTTTADVRHGIVGRNADGLLAACTLLGTFAFARAFDARRGGSSNSSTRAGAGGSDDALSLVPVVIVGIALTLSVPLGLVSLQRQAERYGVPLRTLLDGRVRHRRRGAANGGGSRSSISSSNDDKDDDEVDEVDDEDNAQEQRGASTRSSDKRTHDSSNGDHVEDDDALDEHAPPLVHVVRRRQSTSTPSSSWSSRNSSMTMREDDVDEGDNDDTSATTRTAAAAERQQRSSRRWRRRRRGALGVTYSLAVLIGALLAMLMPFAVLLLVYACVRAVTPIYTVAVHAMSALVGAFALVLLLPLVAAPALHHSRVLRNVHSALCCWLLYSIPTVVVLSALLPLLANTRGAWLTATNMVLLSVFSVIPCVHVLGYVVSVAWLGSALQYHVYVCAYARRERVAWCTAVSDVVVAVLWVCYIQRYRGQPHLTGRYHSERAVLFFQRYLFRGLAHYFGLRVIVCDDAVAGSCSCSSTASAGVHTAPTRVYLGSDDAAATSSSSPQYLFSMHPHGIFPMSAAYVPHTVQWYRKVGRCTRRRDESDTSKKAAAVGGGDVAEDNNSKNAKNTAMCVPFVSTHAADVMFSVPLLRDVVMCLGGMSVSRRALEHSLRSGNSPLIVTGGQSEMLLMRSSTRAMHLLCNHVGFIRLALQHRVPLVPIIAFAENNVLDMVHLPRLQRWCLRRVAFPLPVVPYGRWGLPLPRTRPMTMVVGRALWPRAGRDDADDVQCVREMQYRYLTHLEWLFYTYRRTAGYADMMLYLHHGVDDAGHTATPLSRDEDADDAADCMTTGRVDDGDVVLRYRSAVPHTLGFRLVDGHCESNDTAATAEGKKVQ